ncbi:hypothetical protein [Poriferisphaera sp. WC338]|uniref:hypothetical protein n=1 Tax=Poriferisphaera sp. WC338 TaxID=3425129 RepID=UPI003D81B17E
MNDSFDKPPQDDEPQIPPPQPNTPQNQSFSNNPPQHPSNQSPQPTNIHCVKCGYNLTGIAIGTSCPECGTDINLSLQGGFKPTSGYAITSLVLGILSVITCCFWGVPGSIFGTLAIIFGGLAKRDYRDGKCGNSSRGMATAGRICGIVGLAIGLAYIILIIIAIVRDNM